MEIKVVGEEIWLNGFRVAEINPAKALSYSELEEFKRYIVTNKDLRYSVSTFASGPYATGSSK